MLTRHRVGAALGLTAATAMRMVATHELGHAYGLAHMSTSCGGTKTVMVQGATSGPAVGGPNRGLTTSAASTRSTEWGDGEMASKLVMTSFTVACAVALTACGQKEPEPIQTSPTTMVASVDYQTYSSPESLGSASTVVLRGSFNKLVRRDVERSFALGGDPDQEGLPVMVWEFNVDQQLKGPTVGSRVEVLTFDLDRLHMDGEEPFKPGAEVLLFMSRERKGVWARSAGDQAVLDVQPNGLLRAHQAADPALKRQAAQTSAADIRRLVQPAP